MRGLATDHVISGPMKVLKKLHWKAQTDRHGNTMTESAQWGRFSENPKRPKDNQQQTIHCTFQFIDSTNQETV